MQGALEGIRVIDLSLLLPGPLCSMYLGDMGADIIKIENPRMPDMTRLMGSRVKSADGASDESGMFLAVNRNKRSITLNLKRPEGREILMRLLEDADILLEGFRPGALEDMGIGYKQLKEKFPRLIYCAISGYGDSGPYRRLAGHDANYIAYSGLLGITGEADGAPVLPGVQVADIGGGTLTALSSILAALFARERTGQGQFLDISMMDGAFAFLSIHAGEYLATGREPERGRMSLSGGLTNYQVYRTRDDRYVMLGALEERFFRSFLRQVGREELLEGRDLSPEGVAGLRPELERIFAERTRDEWAELFANADTCLAPVNSMAEAFADPQLKERGMVVEMDHPKLGAVTMIGSPFHMSETPASYRLPPPEHGEHTAEVLGPLGYDADRLEELKRKRVI